MIETRPTRASNRTFYRARLVAIVSGALGVFITLVLLFNLLVPQWLRDPARVDLDTIVRQTIFIGIPTLASILIVVYSWSARIETRRASGIAIVLSALPLLLAGLLGYFGLSVVFVYFLPGLTAFISALVIAYG